jgi:hypothetical protein
MTITDNHKKSLYAKSVLNSNKREGNLMALHALSSHKAMRRAFAIPPAPEEKH